MVTQDLARLKQDLDGRRLSRWRSTLGMAVPAAALASFDGAPRDAGPSRADAAEAGRDRRLPAARWVTTALHTLAGFDRWTACACAPGSARRCSSCSRPASSPDSSRG